MTNGNTAADHGGGFVSIVGHLDLEEQSGKIDFVGPGAKPLPSGMEANSRVELEIRDKEGKVLGGFSVALRRPTWEQGKAPYGLVQESVPRMPGMAEVVLKLDGSVIDSFKATSPPGAFSSLWLKATRAISRAVEYAGMAGPGRTEQALKGDCIVQVRKDDERVWQTIATGRAADEDDVDVTQFPGAQKLAVRVLQPDGFDWTVIRERLLDLKDDNNPASSSAKKERAAHAGEN